MITVCGEALVDLIEQRPGQFHAHPGGSPLNVAVALARLGQPVSLLARLSHDRFGRLLRGHLTGAGVSPRDLRAAGEPTTLAVVGLDGDGAARYDFYVTGTADWQWRPADLPDPLGSDVTALHVGSLASWLPPGAEAIEAMLVREHRRSAVTLSFDPNVRPALMGEPAGVRPRVERLVGLAAVVKASDEDLRWLYPGADPDRVARDWSRAGPALVVLTGGAAGAAAFTPAGPPVRVPARPARVVDTVGAGDAFTAGLLDGLGRAGVLGPGRRTDGLDTAAVAAVLDRAALVAALACTRRGADPPTGDQVDAAAAEHRPGRGSGSA